MLTLCDTSSSPATEPPSSVDPFRTKNWYRTMPVCPMPMHVYNNSPQYYCQKCSNVIYMHAETLYWRVETGFLEKKEEERFLEEGNEESDDAVCRTKRGEGCGGHSQVPCFQPPTRGKTTDLVLLNSPFSGPPPPDD
ncbi:Os03g0442250 [Oryza sativa Japonica Group]|uniref:Os03g0442250 protein n=1 Tax=Oryza sativa subsp. japonica TaxID=39947 RepID=A0A0P0VZA4_ORYSJ|nr:Os03g0442250 [Oryza sativa Japonica Group]